jgi:hypothetical protein
MPYIGFPFLYGQCTMQDIIKIDEFGIGKSLQHHLVCGSTRSNGKHPASVQIDSLLIDCCSLLHPVRNNKEKRKRAEIFIDRLFL